MGRRKIEIKKIANKAYLMATFSKRRKGLFRKAAELCDMSGAEIAILTVSPGGKFYNFGHPNVDSIVARYSGDGTSSTVDANHDCVGNPNVDSVVARQSGDGTLSTIDENHDCDVSHEEDDDEGLEGEHEKEDGSSDEVDEVDEDEDEDEDMDGRSLLSMAGEEKEPIDESSVGISDKFWWDEEEPVDPEQRKIYICSVQELRNNVLWLLNDRKMRESYVKDYISGI